MAHIEYKNDKFVIGERPNNQGSFSVLSKIAARLEGESQKAGVKLTQKQKQFIQHFNIYNREYKRSLDKVDIAHGIAISKIMQLFVDVLNNPTTFLDNSDNFERLKNFFENIKTNFKSNGMTTEELNRILEDANKIISKLNQCSRNLVPGESSTNRSISQREDPPIYYFGQDNFYLKIPYAEKISTALKQLPGYENYRPVMNKQGYMKSSSVGNQFLDQVLSIADYNALLHTQNLINVALDINAASTITDTEAVQIYSSNKGDVNAKKRSSTDIESDKPNKKSTSAHDLFNPKKTLNTENYLAYWNNICTQLSEGIKPPYEHDLTHMSLHFMQEIEIYDEEIVSNHILKLSNYLELISPNEQPFDIDSAKELANELLIDINSYYYDEHQNPVINI